MTPDDLPPRLAAKILLLPNGCWFWAAGKDGNGYGKVRWGPERRIRKAHAVVWEIANDEVVPEGLEPDHLCRNPACVRPDHLEMVTHQVNTQRRTYAYVTSCPEGHSYAAPHLAHKRNGHRYCRTCDNRQQRERWARRRDALTVEPT